MRLARSVILFALSVLVFHAAGAETAESSRPPQFKLVAGYGSGSIFVDDSIYAWDITIAASGKALIEGYRHGNERPEQHTVDLPRIGLEEIVAALDRSKFFALPADMDGEISDTPAFTLELTRDGKRHRVRVSGPAGIHDKALLKRFILVWEAIFRYIHSPEGEASLKYLRANS